jgi:hypothetical protein
MVDTKKKTGNSKSALSCYILNLNVITKIDRKGTISKILKAATLAIKFVFQQFLGW